MITSQRTMPESEFRPEDSAESYFDAAAAERLNASELQTVLDMLAAMETAEELSQLQALTEVQKRQVWEATSESLKQKLWQLRSQPAVSQKAVSSIADNPIAVETTKRQAEYQEAETETDETEADRDDEIEDLGQDLDLTTESYGSLQTANQMPLTEAALSDRAKLANRIQQSNSDRLRPTVGDSVVFKANAKLSAAELKAIWQLERIEGSEGSVSHSTLGTRSYPLSWMVVYPRVQSESAADAADRLNFDHLDSEELF